MSDSTSKLTSLDRTRLLLGVVIIPLAATCALAYGVASYRVVQSSQNPSELRVVFADRERRDAASEALLCADGQQEETKRQTHYLPSYAVYTSRTAAAQGNQRPERQFDLPTNEVPREVAAASSPAVRGPPHAG